MDPAGRNKILSRRRGRKPEEKRFKNTLEEENGAKKTANSNRQDQDISITPLGSPQGFMWTWATAPSIKGCRRTFRSTTTC
jgi:hypothetical protein